MRASFTGPFSISARLVVGLALAASATACAGGPSAPGGAASVERASEAEWRELATARPQPVDGAARVSVGQIRILGEATWSGAGDVTPSLALAELVVAGLLRRQDVSFVERRRFAAAAEAERRGEARGPTAPSVGISPGAELVLAATWSAVGMTSTYLDVRLSDAATGRVAGTWRGTVGNGADPVSLARRIVAGTVAALDEMGRLPSWGDPLPDAAPSEYRPSDIPAAALDAFVRGLAAEERWSWERARAGYQTAAALGGPRFFEAEVLLARTARLRNGGTLGAS